jgi:4-hydroxy-2-oxoheptanedioate aldolase
MGAELMGIAGYDWVCIDTQHGLIGYDQMLLMLQALAITLTPAFVRVSRNEPGEIGKVLDAGAQGVIIPMVNSPEEAAQAVEACRYPPLGSRSWGTNRTSLHVAGYGPEAANHAVICAIMVETLQAIKALPEILAVAGIDAVFVGPSDLALTAGMKPTMDVVEPEHERLIGEILAACLQKGVVAGIYCGGVRTTARWIEAGFRMLAVNSDARMIRATATAELQELRTGATRREAGGGYM